MALPAGAQPGVEPGAACSVTAGEHRADDATDACSNANSDADASYPNADANTSYPDADANTSDTYSDTAASNSYSEAHVDADS